jgi:hypothetical protein
MHAKVIGQAKFVGVQTTKCKKQFVPMYLTFNHHQCLHPSLM